MADRSPARVFAPLALLAAVLGVTLVVMLSRTDSSTPDRGAPPATVAHHAQHAKARARSYVVRAGDSLSAIAVRTGVSVEVLQRLNPNADPQALHVGQRLKLEQ
jgi:LysM repeat protein